MTQPAILSLLDEMKAELVLEYEHMKTGRVQALTQSRNDKARLVRSLEQSLRDGFDSRYRDAITKGVTEISELAKRNDVHLAALKNGISGLISRFQSYGADAGVGAYDQLGQNMSFQRGSGGYVKKV